MTLEFGFQLTPSRHVGVHRERVAAAEEYGLDLVAVQDHPYVPKHHDALVLIGDLLARTERLRFFPDVATLPLRPPAMLAKTAAGLDALSGGRFELGLGAGGYWERIAGMSGIPELTPRQSLDALAEAIPLIRSLWQQNNEVKHEGTYYRAEVTAGPAPAHDIGIWVGSVGPRSFRLTGRLADGWAAPIPIYLPYEKWPDANAVIDKAAYDAGRDPRDVMRMAQIVGTVTDKPGDPNTREGADPLRGTPDEWATFIARLAVEQPFRTFIFWPERHDIQQIELFAREVVPAARALIGE
jgi:alkanesulfonate monooxygenase SsuD/methylene tetrahydromethanopterin reductase-like flavin-dependent oxidoreductase (luciferase family)